MKVFDLTHNISPDMPVYPGTEPPVFEPANSYEVDGFKETKISMFTHTGTHIDPPAHLFPGKKTLDAFEASQFIGSALVIDCRHLKEGELITMEDLAPYGQKVHQVEFLLFNLGWDERWGTPAYFGDYPCVDDQVLDLIIAGNYKGIGFAVIGLDPIADVDLVRHHKLFAAKDIINIENLKNLDKLGSEPVQFACLPIKVQDADGCPARAIAWVEA